MVCLGEKKGVILSISLPDENRTENVKVWIFDLFMTLFLSGLLRPAVKTDAECKAKMGNMEAIQWVMEPSGFKASCIKKPTFPDEDIHIQMGHATVSKLGDLIFYFNNTTVTPGLM